MDTFRTFIIPASLADTARRLTDAMDYPHKGMFVAQVDADGETIAYISSGWLAEDSPFITGDFTGYDPQDVAAIRQAMDNTDNPPIPRMDFVREEVAEGANAPAWVQPTGAHDAYAEDAAVTHAGKAWRNLTPANVWEPGVSGWRLLWGQAGNEWPEWVQPTGAHDAYNIGDKVTFQSKRYVSTINANVWSPTAYPQGWSLQP